MDENHIIVPKTKRRILLAWSGGLDSTYLLLSYLNDESVEVRTVSFLCGQILQSNRQWEARSKIKKLLIEQGKEFHASECQIEFTISMGSREIRSEQAALWAAVTALYADHDECVVMGYVRGDDFWHRGTPGFGAATTALADMLGKSVQYHFPLEWEDKISVLGKMKELYPEFYPHVWFCDLPDKIGNACNECASCISHQRAETIYRSEFDSVKIAGDVLSAPAKRYDCDDTEYPGAL